MGRKGWVETEEVRRAPRGRGARWAPGENGVFALTTERPGEATLMSASGRAIHGRVESSRVREMLMVDVEVKFDVLDASRDFVDAGPIGSSATQWRYD